MRGTTPRQSHCFPLAVQLRAEEDRVGTQASYGATFEDKSLGSLPQLEAGMLVRDGSRRSANGARSKGPTSQHGPGRSICSSVAHVEEDNTRNGNRYPDVANHQESQPNIARHAGSVALNQHLEAVLRGEPSSCVGEVALEDAECAHIQRLIHVRRVVRELEKPHVILRGTPQPIEATRDVCPSRVRTCDLSTPRWRSTRHLDTFENKSSPEVEEDGQLMELNDTVPGGGRLDRRPERGIPVVFPTQRVDVSKIGLTLSVPRSLIHAGNRPDEKSGNTYQPITKSAATMECVARNDTLFSMVHRTRSHSRQSRS